MNSEKFSHSGPLGYVLSKANAERRKRAGIALRDFLPVLPAARGLGDVKATPQVSASVADVCGISILISYLTAVAYRLPDGSFVCTPRNYYSRTTDRSITEFISGPCVELEPSAFAAALRERLRNVGGGK